MHSLPYIYSSFSKMLQMLYVNSTKWSFWHVFPQQMCIKYLHVPAQCNKPYGEMFLQGSAEVFFQKPDIHSGALELVSQISAAGLSLHQTVGGCCSWFHHQLYHQFERKYVSTAGESRASEELSRGWKTATTCLAFSCLFPILWLDFSR